MHKKTVSLALGVVVALAASGAFADNANPNDVRLGMYFVYFDTSATDISGPYTPSGLNLKVNSLETLYLAYVRSFSTHIKVELAFGLPPLTRTVGSGPASLGSVPYNGQSIATARWLSPTLLAEYEFGDENSRWRPYVGAGLNYTKFLARQSTAAGDAASGGPTSISLPAALGPAVTVGMSYKITDRWHVYASYSAAIVDTKLTADTGGILRTSQIQFNPMTLVVSAGYSF